MALTPRRIVVVGLGSIGRRHARLLQARPDLTVEFCEPSRDILALAARELGQARVHPSYQSALASRPDAVVLATPHALHATQTLAALEHGIHVLCEKPMSDSLESARTMRDAARGSRAVLCIGFMLQFHPVMRRLKDLIASGALGRILAIRYLVGAYVTLVNSLSRYQAALEGALLLDYAHQPDILHWLTGRRPAGVYMAGIQGGDLEFQSNPNALSLVCDYDEPLLVTLDLNYIQMPLRHECEVMGDRAWALCDLDQGRIRLGRRDEPKPAEVILTVDRDNLYRDEHQAFLDAMDGTRPPFRSAEEALVSMEVVDAALRSWRERRRVTL
jgi:predicted dehydrogenase